MKLQANKKNYISSILGLKFGWFIKDFYQNQSKYECAYKYSKKLKNIKLSHRTEDFKIDLKKIVPNFKNMKHFLSKIY